MKLVLSSLLLASLCTLSSWSVSSGALDVEQSPDVSVQVGETAKLTCCWTRQDKQVRVVWKKNQTEISNDVCVRNSLEEADKTANNCSTLIFGNVTEEHSGRYVCKVIMEIPALIVKEGNGTVITVVTKEDKSEEPSDTHLPVFIAPAVLVPLLLIALACFCALRWKQAQAARVIYEVPYIDSDADKHSTSSSRGSTQWCEVPMYESVNYFEHVETKESG